MIVFERESTTKEPTKRQVEFVYQSLLKTGRTTHSRVGATLIPVLNRLEQEGRHYRLFAWPGVGYNLEVVREGEET